VKAVAERAATGKAEDLAPLTGEGVRTHFLAALLTNGGWHLPESEPWADAGAMAGISRYELKLEPVAPSTTVPAGPVTMDIERTKTQGWKVKALRFDPALVTQAAEILKAKGVTVDPSALTDPPDALDQARRFFAGVLSHDFKAARSLTDQVRVTHEKLAGMCIVFEEGEYHVAAKRPVVVTAGTADSAWAIVKVRSDKQDIESEVGLEMEHTSAGDWIIHALDFNKMLETYVKATGTGNVFYSPIVKSAKGGESIVLYFEFDKAGLHPRALHQLDIISSLLKSDPARKMRITGHSDALGTDDYNVRLSAERAKNVRARLLELGVSATQIVTVGVGSKAPLDPDRRADGSDNPEGRSRNRRTEIYLDF
jgi:outer membrane protein OmpA-like peptidoglycan-associated protein